MIIIIKKCREAEGWSLTENTAAYSAGLIIYVADTEWCGSVCLRTEHLL